MKLKILYILPQWSKWFIFWNIFLYYKIISFLELFSFNRFLHILLTQLVFCFFSILNLFSMYASHDLYYQYSHFLVHEDNKNTLYFFSNIEKTLLVQQLRIDNFLTNFKCVKTDIYNSCRKLFLLRIN